MILGELLRSHIFQEQMDMDFVPTFCSVFHAHVFLVVALNLYSSLL